MNSLIAVVLETGFSAAGFSAAEAKPGDARLRFCALVHSPGTPPITGKG
jgi:hypothetical protein